MRRRIASAVNWGVLLLLIVLAFGCAYTGASKTAATPEEEYEEARREYEEGHYFDAVLKLSEFIDRYPGSILVDQAIFTLGKSYQAQKDWVLAAAEFERLVRDFPESRSACDAEKALGECYWEQSRKPQYDQRETEQALIQFNRYLNRCPDHPDRAEAEEIVREGRDRLAEKCLRTARLYAKMKKRQSAVIYCDLLLADYGDSRWVCEARELRARLLIDLGRYAEARTDVQWLRENCQDAEGLTRAIEELEVEIAEAERS
jgi:outer membrane protein assembly factor BamD